MKYNYEVLSTSYSVPAPIPAPIVKPTIEEIASLAGRRIRIQMVMTIGRVPGNTGEDALVLRFAYNTLDDLTLRYATLDFRALLKEYNDGTSRALRKLMQYEFYSGAINPRCAIPRSWVAPHDFYTVFRPSPFYLAYIHELGRFYIVNKDALTIDIDMAREQSYIDYLVSTFTHSPFNVSVEKEKPKPSMPENYFDTKLWSDLENSDEPKDLMDRVDLVEPMAQQAGYIRCLIDGVNMGITKVRFIRTTPFGMVYEHRMTRKDLISYFSQVSMECTGMMAARVLNRIRKRVDSLSKVQLLVFPGYGALITGMFKEDNSAFTYFIADGNVEKYIDSMNKYVSPLSVYYLFTT